MSVDTGPGIGLALLGFLLYVYGWIAVRRRGYHRLASMWRLGSALAGTLALLAALLPPITTLETRSFTVHMVQHELLIEVAPTLWWLAQPVPFWLWGLPPRWRRHLVHATLLPAARRRWQAASNPSYLVPLYLLTVTLWHVPALYNAALVRPWLHAVEHASLFLTAALFWWLVTGAGPRLHARAGHRLPLVYVIVAYLHNEILGVGLTLMRTRIYNVHGAVAPPWGLSPIADQSLGGAIMWIPGEFIYAATLMALLMRLLDEGEPFHGIFESYPSYSSEEE